MIGPIGGSAVDVAGFVVWRTFTGKLIVGCDNLAMNVLELLAFNALVRPVSGGVVPGRS